VGKWHRGGGFPSAVRLSWCGGSTVSQQMARVPIPSFDLKLFNLLCSALRASTPFSLN
jgi:hypothetical protein